MTLRRLGLKPQFTIGFGSLLAIIAVMGFIGFRSAAANEQTANELEVYSTLKDSTRSLEKAILTLRLGVRDVLMGRDNETTHLFEHGQADFRQAMVDLKPQLPNEKSRDLYERVAVADSAYSSYVERILALYRGGDELAAVERFKSRDGLALSTALAVAMNDMMAEFERQRHDALIRQIDSDKSSKNLMTLLALAGLAFGLTIATVIARSIVNSMSAMLTMIEAVSSNNLMADDMQVENDDEMGNAALGLNKMKNSLRDVILSISSTAVSVSGSSREISTTASQAAGCAEDQKQQVQQIASTMEEMAATVREVSEHSNRARQAALSAATSARDGGKIVEGVREGMRGIANSVRDSAAKIEDLGARSNEIGKIVRVIDEIAGQTNLLALNAAIEAARAGEQGRGFAVVATEVRRLAERITIATQEIATVIENVQSMTAEAVRQMRLGTAAVEQGVEVTGQAGESIQGIIREADVVGTLVAQIASSATQQAMATEEVTERMNKINKLATESAEGSQLSALGSQQLFNLALGLEKLVDRFDVGQHETGAKQINWRRGHDNGAARVGAQR